MQQQVFLLGAGRSGTTLIQRMFNTYDDVILWGEHAGFLEQLADAYFVLKQNPSMHEYSYNKRVKDPKIDALAYYKDPKHWQAWMNWFGPQNVDDIYRNFLESTFNPEHINKPIWGFKEIRYGRNCKVVRFLQELYPNAIFIAMVRDGLNVIESQLTTFHQGTSKYPKLKRILQLPQLIKIAYNWQKYNATFLHLQKSSSNFILLRYEDFIADRQLIKPILNKLNLDFTSIQEAVFNLNEGRGSSFEDQTQQNERWRVMGWFPIFVAEVIIGKSCLILNYPRPKEYFIATKISGLLAKFTDLFRKGRV